MIRELSLLVFSFSIMVVITGSVFHYFGKGLETFVLNTFIFGAFAYLTSDMLIKEKQK